MTRRSGLTLGMARSTNRPLTSLGLGGDGDEIAAIAEVERRFGVTLNYAQSAQWMTAGDVFSALKTALPPDRRVAPNAWSTFAEAISQETGVDGSAVTPETLLLGKARFDWRIAIGVACGVGIALALAHHS